MEQNDCGKPSVREVTLETKIQDSITIPVKVNKRNTTAIVDSGAEVTIMSEDFFQSFRHPFKVTRKVRLKTAGKNEVMDSVVVEKVDIQIGEKVYRWNIHVAPITDTFILGLDFMKTYAAKLDLEAGTMMLKRLRHSSDNMHQRRWRILQKQ